ncbi:MAG: caspase family protein [Burkholderiaceae bacterium]|nr:caspase family protein [Burkholderiaceae bacterium]
MPSRRWTAARRILALALGCAAVAGLPAIAQPTTGGSATPSQASLVLNTGSHVGPLRRVALDPSGRTAITASDDKTAIVWQLDGMRARHVLRVPVQGGEIGRLYGAARDPLSDRVAIAGTSANPGGRHLIHIFDSASGGFERAFDAHGGDVKRLAWSADGRFIAAVYAREPALRVFGRDGALWFEQRLPADSYGLALTAEGRIAVAAFDRRIRFYRVGAERRVEPDGEVATTLNDPVSVQFSPDARWLAVGYFSRGDERGVQGMLRKRVIVDVVDAASRRVERIFEFRDVEQGNLMTVGWQSDGSALYAGGTGYARLGEFPIKRITWPAGEVSSFVAATDSIQDLAALPDGRMAFASFDGTLGIVQGDRVVARSDGRTQRVIDAADLRISADARVVQWLSAGETSPRSFALDRRRLAGEVPDVTAATPLVRPGFIVTDVSNRAAPTANGAAPAVNGRPVPLLPNETARAAAVLPDRSAVMLGASRALRRVGADGRTQWTREQQTETRAVHVSADGRLVVSALSDGTIRWTRAADGMPLLSLLVLRDGRWVLWTDSGHFDAGPGAEDLVGWLVTRPGGERADYHGASRLRQRFLRPDVIDQVLTQLDVPRAIAVADEARIGLAQAQAREDDLVGEVRASQQPVVVEQAVPAALTLAQAPPTQVASTTVEVEVKVYSGGPAVEQILTARLDGRPVQVVLERTQALPNGETLARLSIQLVRAAGRLQIAAKGPNGVSMPVEFDVRSSAPALSERPRPSLYVVAVGVSRYANPAIDLLQAAKDARDFTRSLTVQEGAFYEAVHSRVLTDGAATRAAVLEALAWLRRAPGPNDVAVLFFAGHGVVDANDTYYFLPHDMRESNLKRTAVSESQLREVLSAVRGRTLFFVDTCYASRAIGRLEARETTRLVNGLSQSELGVIVFSGSAARQESLESTAWGNGAFTKALLDGLKGLADAKRLGFVTHVGLDGYVTQAVRDLTAGRQTPMTAAPVGISDYPIAKVTTSTTSDPSPQRETTP